MSIRRIQAFCLVVALELAFLPGDAVAGGPVKPKDGPLGMKFVSLPKGTFYIFGSPHQPGVKTEVSDNFEIAVHTVTQAQWQALMGENPSFFSRAGAGKDKVKDISAEELKQFPVERVSWNDAQEFLKKLNEKEKGKGYRYRLPTETEWEYACRGGATSQEECSYNYYLARPTNVLSSRDANFNPSPARGPFLGRTAKVGSYAPNKIGLYDMHGNVRQLCEVAEEARGPVCEPGRRLVQFRLRLPGVGPLREPADGAGRCPGLPSGPSAVSVIAREKGRGHVANP